MIVIGADTHKRSHTVAAVEAVTGALARRAHGLGSSVRSFDVLLAWARGHGAERVWAIEDCRHVPGALERFLLARGEAVVRIAPKLTAHARKAAREVGKSDGIDAVAIARAGAARGPGHAARSRSSPVPSSTSGCWSITASGWSRQRTALSNDLRWHLHDLWPETRDPAARADRGLLADPHQRSSGPRRAERPRPHRPRRAAPHPRAHAHDQRRSNASSPRSSPRSRRDCSPNAAAAR